MTRRYRWFGYEPHLLLLVGSGFTFALLLLIITINIIIGVWWVAISSYFVNLKTLATTNGTIIASSVYYTSDEYTVEAGYSIVYEFRVGNRTIQSDQITFVFRSSNDFDFAENYVKKYPVGRTVTVYYDKNNPTFCVLEPEVKLEFREFVREAVKPLILFAIIFIGALMREIWLYY